MMYLFAITSFSANVGWVAFLISIVLAVHAIIGWPQGNPKTIRAPWWSLVISFGLEAAAISAWLSVWLPLLAWMLLFGDQDHWFYHYAWVFAVIIGVSVSAVATARIAFKGAARSYLWIHWPTSILLLITFAIVLTYEATHGILASTPEAAAQKIFLEMKPRFDEPVTLVENTRELPSDLTSGGRKVYWVMGKTEPRAIFSVIPHPQYGWRRADWIGIPKSSDELSRAKEWIKDGNRSGAIAILRQFELHYPDTPAADEARSLLKSLEEKP